jgi:hypothetical protein
MHRIEQDQDNQRPATPTLAPRDVLSVDDARAGDYLDGRRGVDDPPTAAPIETDRAGNGAS